MERSTHIEGHQTTSQFVAAEGSLLALDDLPLDEGLPQHRLNLENKTRSNPLPWRGQFSPELVEALVKQYAPSATQILDPFAGSGTVLLEASRLGLSAVGSEVNPAAFHLASVYQLANLAVAERRELLRRVERELVDHFVFQDGSAVSATSKMQFCSSLRTFMEAADVDSLSVVSRAFVILLDIWKPKVSSDDVFITWNRLKHLILGLPHSVPALRMLWTDARRLPLDDACIDFVITSPPYINVFNYHQQYRASAEFLGHELLDVAKSEIGSNRKHRSNRFLTVVQYILDMTEVLVELCRVARAGTKAIFVVGRESNVKKTRFFNSEILASLAPTVGIKVHGRQERVFTNRFGQAIYEDLLHLELPGIIGAIDYPRVRRLAYETLTNAIDRCPAESQRDLGAAIHELPAVQSSPIFRTSQGNEVDEKTAS